MKDDIAIRLRGVTAGYGDRVVLTDVDLDVGRGALLAVIGPNGAGKSTLLKVLAGLLPIRSGSAEVLGGPPGRSASRVAFLPQAEEVDWAFPVTVADVVMMARYPRIGIARRPGPADHAAVEAALEVVAMTPFRERRIGALSGGQRRRTFLARALAAGPDLYLLDEPVTGVDATTQHDLMDVLEGEARAGRTVIASTHDLAGAAHRFQDAVLVNGRIVAHGPARDLIHDARLLAATYGGTVVIPEPVDGVILIDDAAHHLEPDRR